MFLFRVKLHTFSCNYDASVLHAHSILINVIAFYIVGIVDVRGMIPFNIILTLY